MYGVPSQTPEVTFSGGSSELPQTPFPVAGSIYGPSAMLRFLHPKRYQVLVDAPPASECRSEELSSSTSGDHEGLHPTSVRFRRYPLRGTVLAASLALRGDSVTGVNANYHLPTSLSTPSQNPFQAPQKPVKHSLAALSPKLSTNIQLMFIDHETCFSMTVRIPKKHSPPPFLTETTADTQNMTAVFLVISIYLLFLAAGSRSHLPGQSPLLRLLIPSWRFFEEVGEVPELLHREGSGVNNMGPWKRTLKRPTRGLLLNAYENLYLAQKGLLGHLLADIADIKELKPQKVLTLQSYQLVANMVGEELVHPDHYFQFKLIDCAPGSAGETFFISGVHHGSD